MTLQSQTVWSGHPGQEEGPDSEVCALGRSQRSWFGHGAVPWTGASEIHDPNLAGREPWSSQGGARHQGGESVDPQAGWGLQRDLRQLLQLPDLSGSTTQTSCPAERALSEPGCQQGLGVSASLGRYEAESGVLAGMQGMTDSETGDTVGTVSMAGTGNMAGTGSRVESGCRAEAEAAAAAGWADSVPKV